LLKVGQKFTGEVRDLASDGRGVVVHPQGRTFFVPGVWLGEAGEFRVTGLKGRIGFAELISADEEARHLSRVTPACEHHGFSENTCGGCPWQFMAYEQQLAAKQARVQKAMKRLACEDKVQPILASPQQLGYRNRAQLKTDGRKLGYMAANSNQLVDVGACPVLSQHNQQTLQHLRALLPNAEWRPTAKQKWTSLDIDESVSADTASVDSRLPFQQANTQQNAVIRSWLAEGLSRYAAGKSVLELFCGSGNLTEVIAASCAQSTLAVEAVETALEGLKARKLQNVSTLACNLFSEIDAEKLLPHVKTAEILVLDPPREGLKVSKPLFVKKSVIQQVFYISCDLATFSRDLGVFMENGFKVVEVQPLDMSPQTPHIELMAVLSKS